MDISQFIFKLIRELNKNEFYNVEVSKKYNKCDNTYSIQVTADKNNGEYTHGYMINIDVTELDNNSINKIVNKLLWW